MSIINGVQADVSVTLIIGQNEDDIRLRGAVVNTPCRKRHATGQDKTRGKPGELSFYHE